MIFPVFLFTLMSAITAGRAFEKPPIATPRPVTTSPFPRFEAGTCGFQFAAFATAFSTLTQRLP